jgi:hypothetical protein
MAAQAVAPDVEKGGKWRISERLFSFEHKIITF